MKKIIVPILLCLFSLVSFAQFKRTDPRPLKGLDASKIPVRKSFKDLKPNPGGLLNGAVEIGKAEWVTMNVESSHIVANDTKNQAPNDISSNTIHQLRASTRACAVVIADPKTPSSALWCTRIQWGFVPLLPAVDTRSGFAERRVLRNDVPLPLV